MKKNYFILLATVLMLHTTSWAQTNTFPPNGNVGIGTLDPQEKLHVHGSNPATETFLLLSGIASGILFSPTPGPPRDLTVPAIGLTTTTNLHYHSTSNEGDFNIRSGEERDIVLGTLEMGAINGTERMRILNNGNIGIGTGAPTATLHTNGTLRFQNLSQSFGIPRVLVSDVSGNIGWVSESTLQRSNEEIQDVVGTMVSGNTETRISVTYDDISNEFDFVVEGNLSQYNNDAGFITNPDDADADPANELQTLNFNGATNILSITGGNNVDLSSLAGGVGTPHDFPSYPDSAGDLGGITNSFFGHQAGFDNTNAGFYNTFTGYRSGYENTDGDANTFTGYQSGLDNTTGDNNTFTGYRSGYNNIAGNSNTFSGRDSGYNNTNGNNNTFLGYRSGYLNQTGSNNVFLGYNAGYLEPGSNLLYIDNSSTANPLIWGNFSTNQLNFNGNVGINTTNPTHRLEITGGDMDINDGTYFLRNSLNDTNGIGYNTEGGTQVTVFSDNIIDFTESDSNSIVMRIEGDTGEIGIGTTAPTATLHVNGAVRLQGIAQNDALTQVLVSDANGNVSWREDTTFGDTHDSPSYPASAGNATNNNSFFGDLAGAAITTGADNTLVGFQSGVMNTTGYDNSSLGSQTLGNNTTGYRNTANGVYTLHWNSEGKENTAVGYAALGFNTTGNDNTAVGHLAMRGNFTQALNTGNSNAAMGYQAMLSNDAGTGNTAMGRDALSNNTAGNDNVAVGREALTNNVTGSENVTIGFNSGPTVGNTNLTNTIAIGSNVGITASNQVRLGNFEVEDILGAANWTVVSDGRFKINVEEDVAGLDFINSLRVVSYNLDRRKIRAFNGTTNPTNSDVSKKTVGFIAQEVDQLVKEGGYVFTGVKTPANEKDHYGLRYAEFVAPLTKAIQELNALVEAQQQKIEQLENMVYGSETINPSTSTESLKEETTLTKGFSLAQNTPNPFDKTTMISATIPESVRQAKITIYNLNGLELESYDLNRRGNVSVEVSGGRFPSGMYLYALIADGQVIDTKKMILTR